MIIYNCHLVESKSLVMKLKIKLASGNIMYYSKHDNCTVSTAFIISPDNTFLGGFAGLEADRKLIAFKALKGVEITTIDTIPSVKSFNTDTFCQWIGTASKLFLDHTDFMVNDRENGAPNACSERQYYFKAVGLESMYETRIECPIWALIANHVSVFGVTNFNQTFMRGSELKHTSSDERVDDKFKTRYFKDNFKAPAYYLRKATQCEM